MITPFSKDLIKLALDPKGPTVIAVNGGIGAGKSYALAQTIFAVAISRPKCKILVSAGSSNLLMATLQPKCKEVFQAHATWNGGVQHPHFTFINGSEVDFRAYQLPSTKTEAENPWEGRSYHFALVDEIEQLPESAMTHSLQRTREPALDLNKHTHLPTVVWCGRPGAIQHWIDYTLDLQSKGVKTAILRPRTRDNPFLWIEDPESGELKNPYLEGLQASLSREAYECLTQDTPGATMSLEGGIYDNFKPTLYPDGNLLDEPLDYNYPTELAIDFGVHTTAVLWIQKRPQTSPDSPPTYLIVDEWCPDQPTSTQDIIREVLSRPWNLTEAYTDPAGNQRSRTSNLISEVSLLRRPKEDTNNPDGLGGGLGIPIIASPLTGELSRIKVGIYKIKALIESAQGKRTLLIHTSLWESPKYTRGIRHTIQQYAWDKTTGEPLKGRAGHEADHISDALRYFIARQSSYKAHGDIPAPAPTQAPPPRAAALREAPRSPQPLRRSQALRQR